MFRDIYQLINHLNYLIKVSNNPYWVSKYKEYINNRKNINHNWVYDLGINAFVNKIKKMIDVDRNINLYNLIERMCIQICSRHLVNVIESVKYNEQINDFLIELSREISYCQVNDLSYKPKQIYSRLMSGLSESALINQKCERCGGYLKSSRRQCQDLKCSKCYSQIEVKFIGSKKINTTTIKSGLPEGVTEWKNNNGKLIVLTNKGYFIIDSEMVNVSNYIHNLDPEWRKSSILNTKKKSSMTFEISNLRQFPVFYDFRWTDYISKITVFLDKLYCNYYSLNYYKVNNNSSHYKYVKKALTYFQYVIDNQHSLKMRFIKVKKR